MKKRIFALSSMLALNLLQVGVTEAKTAKISVNSAGEVVDAEMPEEAQIRETLFQFQVPTNEEKAARRKESEKNRSLASGGPSKKDMSPELQAMLEELHVAQTPEKIEVLFQKWEKEYASAPTDKKFYIATFAPLHAFRGIVFRLRPLIRGKSNFIHSALLTQVKILSTRAHIYLPQSSAQAFYDYVTLPYLNNNGKIASEKEFKTETDLALWSANELLPILAKTAERLENLSLSKAIVWDQRAIFGKNAFADDLGRFKWVGEFEKEIALSGAYQGISSICMERAYNTAGSIQLAKKIGLEYGMDGFLSDIEGGSSKKVVGVIQNGSQKNDDGSLVFKSDYELLFRMRKSAKSWMARSREANLRAFTTFKDAWNSTTKERQDAPLYLVNTSYFNVDRNKIGDNLEIIERILHSKGVESLRSSVTGEVVKVNYSELFTNPPFDLKNFLPTDFDRRENTLRTIASTDGKIKTQINYRNYGFGEPTKWRVEEYRKYFPSIQSSDDIPRTMRVLSHATGGWLKFPN